MYDSSTYGRKGVIQIAANFLLNIGQRVYSQGDVEKKQMTVKLELRAPRTRRCANIVETFLLQNVIDLVIFEHCHMYFTSN